MLEFKTLTWSNFLSYGNKPTTYDFRKGVTRIAGENGTGKSTIVDALWFALFGKTYRKIKLGQLMNSINKKGMEVILEFTNNGTEYRIERGMHPHFFRIYENGEIVPQASRNKTYQEALEQEIMHFGENTADQTLIKSLTKNISFLTLPKWHKRVVVEAIFDIEIFSTMNRMAKTKYDETEAKLNNIRKDIDSNKKLYDAELLNLNNLRRLKEKLEEDARRQTEMSEGKIAELRADIEKYNKGLTMIAGYKQKHADLQKNRAQLKSDIKVLDDRRTSNLSKLTLIKNKYKIFAETCPGCAKLAEIANTDEADKYTALVTQCESEVSIKKAEIAELDKQIRKLEELIYNENFLKSNITKHQKLIDEMLQVAASAASESVIIDETKLTEYKTAKEDLEVMFNVESKKKKVLSVTRMLLGDEGIKTFIIKRHLPSINKLLNTYLQKFGADILFYFDSEFNEVIGTRYKEDFNYYSFSEGQKRRIDLAVLFAFTEFCKIKNRKANTNLMILDEITAGCDAAAENALYDILREVVNREGKEIITVSHSLAIDPEKVDRLYQTTMDKGFSKLTRVEE